MMTPICPRFLNLINDFLLLRFRARTPEDLSAIEVIYLILLVFSRLVPINYHYLRPMNKIQELISNNALSGVHKHRSPDDGEGVSPYFGMGANWMLLGSLGRPSSLALAGSWSRRRKTLISIPGQTQLVSLVRQSV